MKTYSTSEIDDLYKNQKGLSKEEQRVLNASMWGRKRLSNFFGNSSEWCNVRVESEYIYIVILNKLLGNATFDYTSGVCKIY